MRDAKPYDPKKDDPMSVALTVASLAVIGFAVLILVSGELSQRLGLSFPGRVLLAGLLGFGVLGVAIKAAILLSLQSTDTLASVVTAVETSVPRAADRGVEAASPALTMQARGMAWRTLPATAPAPENAELVELGGRLFFDQRLSADGTVSCASCHSITDGGGDDRPTSLGVAGKTGDRNAPTVLNAGALTRLFWDGRAASLEEQALGPLTNPVEMALPSLDHVVAIVAADADYRARFKAAFGAPPRIETVVAAIAAFERTLVSGNAPYDRFVAGDDAALDDRQKRGLALFDEIGCRACHPDPWFTVAAEARANPYRKFPVFAATRLPDHYDLTADPGRNGTGTWRVPSLRNVARTAPYFHNGAVDRLEDAVRLMAEAQLGRPVSTDGMARIEIRRDAFGRPIVTRDRPLTEAEIGDITAFLHALTSDVPTITGTAITP